MTIHAKARIREYGCQSMVGELLRVIVRRPDENFANVDPGQWNYAGKPDLERARAEHDNLVSLLKHTGTEVIYHDEGQPQRADSIYTHDPAVVTNAGAIVLRMGKAKRVGEEAALGRLLHSLDIPTLGVIAEPGTAEGGDLLWLDENTLAIGVGFRTNADGARQLTRLLEPVGVSTLVYQLPYYRGASSCLHLMSLLSLIDYDLAVIYRELAPVVFCQELERRGIELIDVPEREFLKGMATNVLATAPRECIMLECNPLTEQLLRDARCIVSTFRGEEISLKAEGGPTCLTRPILRAAGNGA